MTNQILACIQFLNNEAKDGNNDFIKIRCYLINDEHIYLQTPYSTIVRPRSSPKKRKNTFKGGPILMRSRHGPYLSKGETERLVNAATRLLVASVSVDIFSYLAVG